MSSAGLASEIERQKQTVDRLNEEAYDNRYNNTALTEKLAQDALQIARKIHYQEGEAWALRNLGIAKAIQGKGEEAIQHFQEALQIFERLDNFKGLGLTLSNLGTVHQQNGLSGKSRTVPCPFPSLFGAYTGAEFLLCADPRKLRQSFWRAGAV
jgi:tetratricopeptide (TPR) repeat protein